MNAVDSLKALIRDRFDDNQAAFARAISRSPSQVSQWLTGYRRFDVKGQQIVATALNLPRNYFDLQHYQHHPAVSHHVAEPPESGTARHGHSGLPEKGAFHAITIIEYGDIMEGNLQDESVFQHPDRQTVIVPAPVGSRAFALRIEDNDMTSGSPPLVPGMVVILDPDMPPTNGAIVLAHQPGTRPVIRQLLIDGPAYYLKAPNLPAREIDPACILATARKAVIDL